MNILLAAILGLVAGSFLNAFIYRLDSGESIIFGRSHCPHCHHELGAKDLIPLVSFIMLGGRCRYCGKSISWQYPVIEAFTAAIFVIALAQFGLTLSLIWVLVFVCILIIIGTFDFQHYLILDRIIYPAFVLALARNLYLDIDVHQTIFSFHSFTADGIAAALVISGFFALQYFLSKGRWIGFGDVKFGLFLGALLGLKLGLIMLLVAYWLGAIIGLVLIAMGRKNLGSKVPFGSFLAFSAIMILLYGELISAWYLKALRL